MPMFHIAGAGWAMVGLYDGCRTVVLRDVDPAAILAARSPSTGSPTRFLVPAVIQFLLMTPGVETTDFSTPARASSTAPRRSPTTVLDEGACERSAASSSRCTA